MPSSDRVRRKPNVLVTGTPGTGKTTTCSLVAEAAELRHINVSELVKQKNLHDGWDDELHCHVINEDLFLDEEKFKETVHKLEQESGFFFNMKHFEDQVQAGEWDEVERYLCGFTKVEDNRYSMKIFFEIRKQKYLEALDRQDRAKAVEILVKDLKVFASFNEELFKEITQLLTLENFRPVTDFNEIANHFLECIYIHCHNISSQVMC